MTVTRKTDAIIQENVPESYHAFIEIGPRVPTLPSKQKRESSSSESEIISIKQVQISRSSDQDSSSSLGDNQPVTVYETSVFQQTIEKVSVKEVFTQEIKSVDSEEIVFHLKTRRETSSGSSSSSEDSDGKVRKNVQTVPIPASVGESYIPLHIKLNVPTSTHENEHMSSHLTLNVNAESPNPRVVDVYLECAPRDALQSVTSPERHRQIRITQPGIKPCDFVPI